MNLKLQLKILSFLQFCLWGSWLTTTGSYMFVTLKFDGASIGAVYSSLGIAAVFMPTLLGIVADQWLRLYLGGIVSGKVVEYYTQNGITDWQTVWLIFAGYSLVLAFAFVALFKYKHVRVPASSQPVAH